jgi:hypothetical protein
MKLSRVVYIFVTLLSATNIIYSNELTGLSTYKIFSNFPGAQVYQLDPSLKTKSPLLKNEVGKQKIKSVYLFQALDTGFYADVSVSDPDQYVSFKAKFQNSGEFEEKLPTQKMSDFLSFRKVSYTGDKSLITNRNFNLAYVDFSKPAESIEILKDKRNLDAIFLRNDKAIIYQTADFKIKRYDIKTGQLEVLIEANTPILFGDVSYDNTKILCTDERQILILDLKEKRIKTIKEYHPSLFTFRRNAPASSGYSRPIIVTGQFSWREDGKGFIFCRYGTWANFLWLGLDESYNEPDLYYFDLEAGEETLLWGGTGKGGIALRKKLGQDEAPKQD